MFLQVDFRKTTDPGKVLFGRRFTGFLQRFIYPYRQKVSSALTCMLSQDTHEQSTPASAKYRTTSAYRREITPLGFATRQKKKKNANDILLSV